VVLAAGFGSRLAAAGDSSSQKPLLEVAGRPLFDRTLHSLELAGCERVVIVVGHEADALQRRIEADYSGSLPLTFAENPNYQLANGLSVLCAAPLVGDEFVLTMADHVLGDEVMELARHHHPPAAGATLLVDFKLDTIFDMDDATKVLAADGLIRAIGKQIPEYNCVDTGVFVCSRALFDALAEVRDRRGDASLSDGIQSLASAGTMAVLDIGDGFWQDVDTPEMLGHAEAMLRQRH
jgi:choline kinase